MKKIKASLSVESLDEAIKQVTDYRKRVIEAIKQLVKIMCEEGESYAIMHLNHVDTGETMASIRAAYRSSNYGIILVEGNAVWIEFGTGVAKNGSVGSFPHPDADKYKPQGIVGIGQYGKGHGGNPNGWYYEDPPKSGQYHFTRGIEANPFMWETAQFLRKNLKRFAKEALHDSDK